MHQFQSRRCAQGTCRRGLRSLLPMVVLAVLTWASQVMATPTTVTVGPWDVTFYNKGDRYRDGGLRVNGAKDWTATEIGDVTSMLGVWDQSIANAAPPRQIKLTMAWSALGTNILGSSYNPLRGDYTHAWTSAEALWRQGQDFSDTSDALIQLGTGITWHTGSTLPLSNEIDLRSVVVHEIGHTLGFYDSYTSWTDRFWSGGLTAWDSFLRDAPTGGNAPSIGGSGTPGDFNETAGPVYFVGPNAQAANGGKPVAIYAPNPFQNGSSLAHLDDATFPDALMKHAIGYGDYVRQPTVLEWRMMQDLGWDVNLHLLPGDANRDGIVDMADYALWFNNYGTGTQWEQANMDGSGFTDMGDYALWFNNYGSVAAAVPEPGTIGMTIMFVLMLFSPGRRP